jgi:hypothetical protein
MISHGIMRSFTAAALALAAAVSTAGAGCATPPAPAPAAVARPRPVAPAPAPPRPMKLAVLPVEKLLVPKVAGELNARLGKASVPGFGESATETETVSMEVALMQLDCAQPTGACYARIAKQFEADRLLWAEIERAQGRKRKKTAPTTIRVFLFDAGRGEVVGRAEQTFTSARSVSGDELDRLIARATGGEQTVMPPVQR